MDRVHSSISKLLDSLLTTPHRDLDPLADIHGETLSHDPDFYARLAVWHRERGEVRDHHELFAAHLLTAENEHLRRVGADLLQELPPHQVARVVDFMKQRFGKTPRSTKTAVVRYLRKRESDPDHFDRAAVRSRKAMKTLYASLHVKPCERANAILFKNDPPPESLAFAVKRLARAEPGEQAALIRRHRIPWAVAVGAVSELEREVYAALVENMTTAEVVNNLKAMRNRGLLTWPHIGGLIRRKLDGSPASVAAFKPMMAGDAGHDPVNQALKQLTNQKIKRFGQLTKPAGLLVDKSQSMEKAIAVGTRLAAMISGVATAGLRVYAVDGDANLVKSEGVEVSDWERAFQGVQASGCTSLGVGLEAARKARFYMEQLVVVSDMRENTEPYFLSAYKAYGRAMKVTPRVMLIQLGGGPNPLEKKLLEAGLPVRAMKFNGDYYALPNIIPYLAQPSIKELVREIRDTPILDEPGAWLSADP